MMSVAAVFAAMTRSQLHPPSPLSSSNSAINLDAGTAKSSAFQRMQPGIFPRLGFRVGRRKAARPFPAVLPAAGNRRRTIQYSVSVPPSYFSFTNSAYAPFLPAPEPGFAARFNDVSVGKHMTKVGHNIVEQPLIVRNHQQRTLAVAQTVDAVGHHFQSIDVQPRIGFVKIASCGFKTAICKVSSRFFTAGKTDVHRTFEHLGINAQLTPFFTHHFDKFHRIQFRLAVIFAHGVDGMFESWSPARPEFPPDTA